MDAADEIAKVDCVVEEAAVADRVTRKLVPLAQMTQTGVIWLPHSGQRSPRRPRPKPNPNCLQFELPLRTIIGLPSSERQ